MTDSVRQKGLRNGLERMVAICLVGYEIGRKGVKENGKRMIEKVKGA